MRIIVTIAASMALAGMALAACTGSDPVFGDSPTIDEAGSETAATDGSVTNDAAPVEAGGRPRMVDVGMGAFHGCALGEDGSVWCWGSNGGGQLGDGSVGGGRPTAKRVGGLPTIAQLSVGLAHTCALGNDHTIWCWGDNTKGKLSGDPGQDPLCGVVNCSATPRKVLGIVGKQVLALAQTTCAIASSGAVSCWGGNDTARPGRARLQSDARSGHLSGRRGRT